MAMRMWSMPRTLMRLSMFGRAAYRNARVRPIDHRGTPMRAGTIAVGAEWDSFGMRVLCALLLIMAAAGPARADDPYPTRPITIIAPYAAGGSTDLVARILSEGLQARFNQPVTVENRPGG